MSDPGFGKRMTHVLYGKDYRDNRKPLSGIRWDGQVNPLTLLYETAIIVLLWTYTLSQLLKAKLQAIG